MGKTPKLGERILEWRTSMGMTQAQVAAEIGMDQSRLSKWEDGTAVPSAEGWFNLAAFAARNGDAASAFLFWEQAGLKAEDLASLAEVFLLKGDVKMWAILSTAETILKERVADPTTLEDEGKVVLVPPSPFTGGVWQEEPLAVPTRFIANRASTYYLVAKQEPPERGVKRGFAPGDCIVFDACDAPGRKVGPFLGQIVLANFATRRLPPPLLPAPTHISMPDSLLWPTGLVIGRIDGISEHPSARWIVLGPPTETGWTLFNTLRLMRITTPESLVPADLRRRAEPNEYLKALRSAEKDALSEVAFPGGCQIMGRFIGLFNGGGMDDLTPYPR